MQSLVTAFLNRSIQSFENFFRKRIVWVTDQRRDLNGQVSGGAALAAFIGREHYVERRRIYPVQSRIELLRILRLEAAVGNAGLIYVGPESSDGRLVTRYELKAKPTSEQFNALLWIPETLAISKSLRQGAYAEVHRNDLRYFVANDSRSQLAGASISDGDQFIIGAGLAANAHRISLDAGSVSRILKTSLKQFSPTELWELVSRDLSSAFWPMVRPLAVITGTIALLYLVLSSLYLLSFVQLREWQLEKVDALVAPLFKSEREIDLLSGRAISTAKLVDERVVSWPVWEVIPEIWKNQGFLIGLTLEADQVVLQARAPSAVTVLEAISKSPLVAEAKFESGVRQNAGQEEFTIALKLITPRGASK